MTIDSWAYVSHWRDVHPGEKALFSAACVVAALLSRTPLTPMIVAVVCVVLAVSRACIPTRTFLRAAFVPEAFLIWSCLAIALSVRTSGSAVPEGSLVIGSLFYVAPASFATALQALFRSTAALSAVLLFAFTTPMTDTIALLRSLKVPVVLLDIMTLVYRQIFVFDETLARVRTAQSARLGYSDFAASRRSVGLAGGHLLAATIQRSRRATRGLLARGYEGDLRYLSAEYALVPVNLVRGGVAGAAFIAAALFIGA